jgi:hypothetical protein
VKDTDLDDVIVLVEGGFAVLVLHIGLPQFNTTSRLSKIPSFQIISVGTVRTPVTPSSYGITVSVVLVVSFGVVGGSSDSKLRSGALSKWSASGVM